MKGAALLVGANELAAALALEEAAHAADWQHILPLNADLETAAERLRLHIAQNA